MDDDLTPDGLPILKKANQSTSTDDGLPILKKKPLANVPQNGLPSLSNGLNPFQSSQPSTPYSDITTSPQAAQNLQAIQPIQPKPTTPKALSTYWKSLNPNEQQALTQGVQQSQAQHQDESLTATPESEQGDYNYAQTLPGKIQNNLTYLAQKATKGGLQVVKGAAYLAELNKNVQSGLGFTDTNDFDKPFDAADKATDFLSKTSEGQVENNKTMSNLGALAEFLPSALGAEGTGGATFYLQGLGQGKETIDKAEQAGVKINPIVKNAFILGTGAVNGLLMGDLGNGIFKPLSSALKDDVVANITTNAIKDAAGKDITADGFKNLLEQGAKDWTDKALQGGTNFLKNTKKAVTDLSALNVGNFALKQGVDATTDKPVFNENLGDLANQEGETLKSAPLFGSVGSVSDATKLTPFSDYKNAIVDNLMKDSSHENIANTKQFVAQHGEQQGWTPDEITTTNDHIDKIAQVTKSLPKNLSDNKVEPAVDLVLSRNDLQKQLEQTQNDRQQLDPAISNVPSPHEQFLTDKIDQANDKLRDLALGTKTTYSQERDEQGKPTGNFLKTVDSKSEPITENRYNLERAERDAKVTPKIDEQTTPNTEVPVEPQANEAGRTAETATPTNEETTNNQVEAPSVEVKSEPIERQKIPDNEAPDVKELSRNLKEVGTPGISIEPSYERAYEKPNDLTENELDNGNKYVVSRDKKGKVNGTLEVSYNGKDGVEDKPTGVKVAVDEDSRRQGIATALFKHAEDNGIDLSDVTGKATTDAGQSLFEANKKGETQNAIQKFKSGEMGVREQGTVGEGVGGQDQPEEPTGESKSESISSEDTQPKEKEVESEGGSDVKKTILTKRAYEGTIADEVKKHLEDKGLTRKSFTQEERSKQATDFIDKFGEEASRMAVENGDVDGGMAASILAQLQIRNSREMSEFPEGSDERDELAKKQADLISLMEKKGYLGGEFNGQLAHEYQNSELDYAAVKRQVEKTTGKPLTPEQDAKAKSLISENENLKSKLQEAESKLIEETDKAFNLGKEEAKNETKAEKAKRLADRIRKGKIHDRPNIFNSASPASLAWDTAIELTAKTIEAGGKLADAIEAGLEHIKSTDWYKSLSDAKKNLAESEFKNFNNNKSGSTDLEDLQTRFVDKKGNKFTPEEARDIWKYMKQTYIENGTSYRDALSKTADDLGLSWRQVSEAIITPKLQRISDEMWKRQSEFTRQRSNIKNWIGDQDKSLAGKALSKLSGLFRGVSVFGHGGIFVGTHAGMTLFQPSTWNKTIPAFLNGWKFAYGKEGAYQRAMEELQHQPNYLIAQRAGLKNNPERLNAEEYQKSQKYLGKLGLAGERGFNAIKVLRQGLFDYHFNKLSTSEKDDPNVAKSIAHLVNLATGATNLKLPSWVNEASFAGGMEASRWEKLTASPVKATETALNAIFASSKATPAERVFAKIWAKRVGQQIGTYAALLTANAAIQNQVNPKNKVNLTNPDKPDFLKFKFGDISLDPTSGMRSTGMFMHKLAEIPFESKKKLHGDKGIEALGKDLAKYGRGKLAPLYSTGADFFTGQDFSGNTMPYSKDKPGKYNHKLSWSEYAWSKSPLPIAEAAEVAYKSAYEQGGNKVNVKNVMNGLISGAISGTTGMRVSDDENKKK